MTYFLIAVAVLAVISVFLYNGLVKLRNRVENGWSQIDVQLKRRADLIPNLVESVKGYMQHEREVLERVTEARTALMRSESPAQAAEADNQLSGALKSLFAVSEAYPELRASENFSKLQEELSATENRVAYSRQAYNDAVYRYQNARQTLPSSIIAGIAGFEAREYYEVPETDRSPVKVTF
ncbi:MAG: LemA family protein [Thermaerobacterales bacterium]